MLAGWQDLDAQQLRDREIHGAEGEDHQGSRQSMRQEARQQDPALAPQPSREAGGLEAFRRDPLEGGPDDSSSNTMRHGQRTEPEARSVYALVCGCGMAESWFWVHREHA